MTAVEWSIIISLAAQTGLVLALVSKAKNDTYAWARDVFALKADHSVLETRLQAIKDSLDENKILTKEILTKLENKHNV